MVNNNFHSHQVNNAVLWGTLEPFQAVSLLVKKEMPNPQPNNGVISLNPAGTTVGVRSQEHSGAIAAPAPEGIQMSFHCTGVRKSSPSQEK